MFIKLFLPQKNQLISEKQLTDKDLCKVEPVPEHTSTSSLEISCIGNYSFVKFSGLIENVGVRAAVELPIPGTRTLPPARFGAEINIVSRRNHVH